MGSLLGGELGGEGEGVVGGGVSQVVGQVLNGALASDNGLQTDTQRGAGNTWSAVA